MAYRFTAAATGLIPAAVKTAMEGAGSKLATIEKAAITDIPEAISGISIDTTGLAAEIAEELGEVTGGATVPEIVAALAGRSISVTSPVTEDQDIEIVAGDDYLAGSDRQISFSNTTGAWCDGDLTGASAKLVFESKGGNGTNPFDVDGTVVSATGTQQVVFGLTGEQTALFTLVGRRYEHQLQFVDSSGHEETPVSGDVVVKRKF